MKSEPDVIKIDNYRFNKKKNEYLKKDRGFDFYDVINAWESIGNGLGIIKNKNYPNQFIMEIIVNDYPCSVPFLIEENGIIFLKTVYKSRKLIRKYQLKI